MAKSVRRGKGTGNKASAERARAMHVLVVENHSDTRQGVKAFLKVLGYRASFAEDKKAALALAGRQTFDLLLSDISLPDGNGWELLQTLEAQGRRPSHAIAMSGLGDLADRTRSHEAGFELHLVKPFRPEELEQALRRAADSPSRKADETKAPVASASTGGLRQRLHDGLCQHLAAAALLQGALTNRLENLAGAASTEGNRGKDAPSVQIGEAAAEARQISRLLDEALQETLSLMHESA